MGLPEGYDLFSWFNKICGDLNEINMKLAIYQTDWTYFTDAQKNGLKTRVNNTIDQAITDLTELKTDIENIQN